MNRFARSLRKLSIALVLWNSFVFSHTAKAESVATRVEVIWVDSRGSVLNLKWPSRTRWVWKSVSADGYEPTEIPVIRTWVQIPDGIKIEGSSTKLENFSERAKDSPFADASHVVSFDQQNTVMATELNIVDDTGKKSTIGLAVRMIVDRPVVLVNSNCQSLGLNVKDHLLNAPHLFVAATCRVDRDELGLHLFHSDDAKWTGSSLGQDVAHGPDWLYYRIHLSAVPHVLVGSFRVARSSDVISGAYSEYYVSVDKIAPEYQSSRFSFSGDLGMTVLVYAESIRSNVAFTETGITGKLNVGYELISRRLDAGLNMFATLLPLTNSSNNPPVYSARWYGLNGRVGYRLPLDLDATILSVMAGWYFWGMIVPACQGNDCDSSSTIGIPPYGVQSLGGPQAFLRMRRAPIGRRPFSIYLKYAFIQDTPTSVSTQNREIAIGGGYQLSSPGEHKPFTLTMDLSQAQFSNIDHALNLRSYSISINKAF